MAEIPDDACFVYAEFDPDVHGTHPETGEPIWPPMAITALCSERAVADVRLGLTRLGESRGWRVTDVRESRLIGGDDDAVRG